MRLLVAILLLPAVMFGATESVSVDTKTKKVQNPLVKFGSGNTLDCTGATVTNCGSSGGSVAWGSITGTLSAQTDLQSALDAKVPTSRTISTTSPITGGGDLSANRTLAIPAANTSTNGYLTSTDWNTFNGKGTGTVTSIATTSPITGGTITGTGTLGLNVGVDFSFTNRQSININDAFNSTARTCLTLQHSTSGTPANGIGTKLDFNVQESAITERAGSVVVAFSEVTNGIEASYMDLQASPPGVSPATIARFWGSGAVSVNNTVDPGVPGISARFIPQAHAVTSATSWTPNSNTYDQEAQTALAGDLTVNAPSGTPTDGKKLVLRIKNNATPHNITWNGSYTPIGITLPVTIGAFKTIYVGVIWNSNTSVWDALVTSGD